MKHGLILNIFRKYIIELNIYGKKIIYIKNMKKEKKRQIINLKNMNN